MTRDRKHVGEARIVVGNFGKIVARPPWDVKLIFYSSREAVEKDLPSARGG